MAANIGNLTMTIDLVARIGDGEPSTIGTLTVPIHLTATSTDTGVTVQVNDGAPLTGALSAALRDAGKQMMQGFVQ